MLSPDSPTSSLILGGVLWAVLALLIVRAVRKDRREYSRFKRYRSSQSRRRMFRKWLIDSLVMFGGASIVILALVWQYPPRLLAEVRRWPVSAWFSAVVEGSNGLVPGLAIGLAVALVGGTILAVYLARKSVDVPTIGDISALLPRDRRELRYGFALSVNAGVVEELLFRLAMPALIFGVFGNAVLAVVGSVLLFGALHVYQGWAGIVGSIVIGGALMLLYLATGSILAAIVAHALIDLRSLVLIPVLVYRVHTRD
ncbi:CPBP family intramembrane glutamic endopeptidase [Lacisediminihabitans sp.]|uniref:CPBP family intramembrane glutamic endopeptidase n=1 Tax=Lacisediminihabitans sp. TaxID=2787631 RepID=UPI00374CC91B